MTEKTRAGLRWLGTPSPERLMVGLFSVGLVSIVGLIISVLALTQTVASAAEREANEKFQLALCEVWVFNLPRPGDPPRTTEAGRVQVARALEQYNRSGCDRVLQDAGRPTN